MNNIQVHRDDSWSYIGGCSVKHLFNKSKRESCESAFLSKKGVTTSEIEAQANLTLAQAAQAKASQAQQPDAWTPERTAKVVGITLGILAITTIAVVIIRKKRK